jgi:two-component system response regulator YesN
MCSKYIYISELAKVREPFLIERIREYIDKNYNKHITLSTMSEYLRISKSHISHTLKAKMNITFSILLLQKRIEKAKILIEKTNLKMKEISLQTGFIDHNYFSRAYKKIAGCSPTEYRNKKSSN